MDSIDIIEKIKNILYNNYCKYLRKTPSNFNKKPIVHFNSLGGDYGAGCVIFDLKEFNYDLTEFIAMNIIEFSQDSLQLNFSILDEFTKEEIKKKITQFVSFDEAIKITKYLDNNIIYSTFSDGNGGHYFQQTNNKFIYIYTYGS